MPLCLFVYIYTALCIHMDVCQHTSAVHMHPNKHQHPHKASDTQSKCVQQSSSLAPFMSITKQPGEHRRHWATHERVMLLSREWLSALCITLNTHCSRIWLLPRSFKETMWKFCAFCFLLSHFFYLIFDSTFFFLVPRLLLCFHPVA